MGKFLIRITILFTSIFFVYSYYMAQFKGIDTLSDSYSLLFELCVVVCCFGQGKYHCRYIRYLAIGLLLSDLMTRFDNYYNFLSKTEHNAIGLCFIYVGALISIFSAIRHFYKVNKLKRLRKKNEHSNNERDKIVSN